MKELPGYERTKVRDATTAEILSDIRLLTIYVRGDSEKFVREVRNAAEAGLMEFAKQSEELKLIKVIRSEPPVRIYWDDRTAAACSAGGIVMGILAFLAFGFAYALNESIYVQGDVEKTLSLPGSWHPDHEPERAGALCRGVKGGHPLCAWG